MTQHSWLRSVANTAAWWSLGRGLVSGGDNVCPTLPLCQAPIASVVPHSFPFSLIRSVRFRPKADLNRSCLVMLESEGSEPPNRIALGFGRACPAARRTQY